MDRFGIYISRPILVGIRKLSDKSGRTMSEIIRQALEKFLKDEGVLL